MCTCTFIHVCVCVCVLVCALMNKYTCLNGHVCMWSCSRRAWFSWRCDLRREVFALFVQGRSISNQHAILDLSRKNGGLVATLHDCNSRNGTFVNEKRLLGAKTSLVHGDRIRFGFDTGGVISWKKNIHSSLLLAASAQLHS